MLAVENKKNKLIKTYWSEVREHVLKVEPGFSKIVDKIAPDTSFPLYLAYYPYGAIDADTKSSLFPDGSGGYFRLSDSNVPRDILENLGYSKNNTPLGMVLDKQIECFIDLKTERITIPWLVYTPGKIFPLTRILKKQTGHVYAPNGLLSSTAGARSTFMLPNIGCATNHCNLQREYNIQNQAPKSLYDHWFLFRELANSEVIQSDWRCCVMYFSEKWIERIKHDSAWYELKEYLHHLAWSKMEYEMHRVDYDMIFSIIQKNRNLKPNPYLTDTAKHLFSTAIGAAPGYIPATDNEALPLDILQEIYANSYGLKKYIPTIIHPAHYDFEKDKLPIYYSLQNPATHVFSPKSRIGSSTLYEMRELEHIVKIFSKELASSNSMCSENTVMYKIASQLRFNYYHNKHDRHRIVKESSEIISHDDRFSYLANQADHLQFASDGPFVRGCISMHMT